MRRIIVILIALATSACEQPDRDDRPRGERDDEVETARDEGDSPFDRIGASRASSSQRELELERQVDELTKRVAMLEAELAAAKAAPAVPPRPTPRSRSQPNATDVFAVPVDGAASDGPADALVTIVEGYEYACPYCDKVRPTLETLRQRYGDDLRIVKKHFIVHPQTATAAGLAACAAHRQGKFEAMDKLLWEQAFALRKYDAAHIEDLAKQAGLDLARYRTDIAGDCPAVLQRDQQQLQQVGQTGTPNFYVNGRYLAGAQPLATFEQVIDEELKKAKDRIAAGGSRRTYYRDWILDRGLPRFIASTATGP